MKSNRIFAIICCTVFFVNIFSVTTYAQRKELKANEVPKAVITVLNEYLKILSTSKTLDDCANSMVSISGGHMLSSDLQSISNDVIPYSLKKDWQNVKFYQIPPKITRVQLNPNSYDGFENTLIEGDIYKIWIAKKQGGAGLPAPIPIILTKEGKAKVITTIGSL